MKNINFLIILFICSFVSNNSFSQKNFLEVGVGVGNVSGEKHSLGKAELHFSIFRAFDFGKLGLGFSSGGNFIPGERSQVEQNVEIISSNDSRFSSIMILYRLPIIKSIFLEPRVGYTSLNSFVHTDDKTKISQPNFSAGIGIGTTLNRITLSFRYQYLGKTANYEGSKNTIIVKSLEKTISVILLGLSYHLKL